MTIEFITPIKTTPRRIWDMLRPLSDCASDPDQSLQPHSQIRVYACRKPIPSAFYSLQTAYANLSLRRCGMQ